MFNSINKKMLLVVGCLVSGMLVASQKAGEIALKQQVATAVVAQQFCDNPGNHEVEVLSQRPGYEIVAGNSLPTMLSSGALNAIMITKAEKLKGWDHHSEPIHQAVLAKNGDLTTTLCNGQKHTFNIFDRDARKYS